MEGEDKRRHLRRRTFLVRLIGSRAFERSETLRVSDITRLQKLFISVNTPFTRGFWVKIPVYESCAAGAFLGVFG